MTSIRSTERNFFWKRMVKFGFLLLPVFFVIVLLFSNSKDVFSGNFSRVVQNQFTGVGGMIFFGSVIFSSFLCSFVILYYDIEEKRKEEDQTT